MAQQTKKTSILNWQTLSGAGALVAGGIFALYAFGLGSPLSANNQTPQNLTTQGVQNRVQYLKSLEIKGEKGSVTFGYAEKNKVPMLVATGTLNLDNLVVGSTNTTVPTSVVFGGIDNTNSGSSSVIVVGSGNKIADKAQNAILVSSKRSSVGVNAQNVVVLNGENSNIEGSIEGRKNIAAFGKNNQVNGSFLTVMGDNNTVNGDHIVAIGGNVDAAKSNIFVFNAKSEEFMPAHESAFYANSKVAINTESAPAQLTIAGGLKIKIAEKTDLSLRDDYRGVIATFSDGAHTGLCGRDAKGRTDSDRVPLSEAAREFGLCAGRREAVDIPSPSTTIISQTGVVNGKVDLPRQWIVNDRNPDGKRYPWQWRYGSDKLPGYFLCAENHIPDREGNILGRTGVKCIPCENGTAKPGDLNCTPNQEETVEQPKELTCSINQHIENGACVANTKQVACNPAGIDKTNGSFTNAMVTVTWNNGAWSQPATCQLSCNPTYTPAKKSASSLHNDYCAKLTGKWSCQDILSGNGWDSGENGGWATYQKDHTTISRNSGTVTIYPYNAVDGVKKWLENESGRYLLDVGTLYIWGKASNMKGGSFRNPVLYIPISYYVGHPHTSVEAKVHLVMDVSNSVATYRNMEGVFTTITRTNAAGSSTDHISVDLSNLKYEGYPHWIPCDSVENCSITLKEARIELPPLGVNTIPADSEMYGEMKCIHPESNIELDPSFCGPLSPQELQSCNYGSCKITAELAQAEGALYEYRTNGGINGFRPVVWDYAYGELIPFKHAGFFNATLPTVDQKWEFFPPRNQGFYSICKWKNTWEGIYDKDGNEHRNVFQKIN